MHTRPPPCPHAILAAVGKVESLDGIDEATAVEIGGIHQWVTVRERDHGPWHLAAANDDLAKVTSLVKICVGLVHLREFKLAI